MIMRRGTFFVKHFGGKLEGYAEKHFCSFNSLVENWIIMWRGTFVLLFQQFGGKLDDHAEKYFCFSEHFGGKLDGYAERPCTSCAG